MILVVRYWCFYAQVHGSGIGVIACMCCISVVCAYGMFYWCFLKQRRGEWISWGIFMPLIHSLLPSFCSLFFYFFFCLFGGVKWHRIIMHRKDGIGTPYIIEGQMFGLYYTR